MSKGGETELEVRVLVTKILKQDYVMELNANLGWIFKIKLETFVVE